MKVKPKPLSRASLTISARTFNFACWVILHAFLSSANSFQNQFFSKNSFRKTINVEQFGSPGKALHYGEPDLGPNSLQRLSADNISR